MLPLVEFLIWLDENEETIAKMMLGLMGRYHWTPRQVCEDLTIQQLLHLWDYDEQDNPLSWDGTVPRGAIGGNSGDELIRKKIEESKTCQPEQSQEPQLPLHWRYQTKPSGK